MLYIYDVGEITSTIEDFLNEQFKFKERDLEHWCESILRGLLFQCLYINLLPNPELPYVHKDQFNLTIRHPWIESRICQLLKGPYDLSAEWIKMKLDSQGTLRLEYVLKPLDFVIVGEEALHVHHLLNRRSLR